MRIVAGCVIAAITALVPVCAAAQREAAPTETAAPPASAFPARLLPAGTIVQVAVESDLSTATNAVGDEFPIAVAEDVVADGIAVIPKGTRGTGEVTFRTQKGGFGKPGILGIAVRALDLRGKRIALDGRYREEGRNNDAAAGVTMFAVGIFAAFVQGTGGNIPKGRILRARTAEDLPVIAGLVPMPVPAPEIAAAPALAPR